MLDDNDYAPPPAPPTAPEGFVKEAAAFHELWNAGWTRRGFIFESERKDRTWEFCFDPQYSRWKQARADSWAELLAKLEAQAEARGGLD